MSGPTGSFALHSAHDLWAKLQRDHASLKMEVTSDAAFNFVVTAYHLREWIQKDATLEDPTGKLEELWQCTEFQACRDLANASKHFMLDPKRNPDPTVGATDSQRGYGVGRYGRGPYGSGEEDITVQLNLGGSIGLLDLADALVARYRSILEAMSDG